MGQATGNVEQISTRPTSNGGTAYNIKLSDGAWYGYGFDAPNFVQGNNVSFAFAQNGNFKNVDASTVVVNAVAAAASQAVSSAAPAPSYDDRQLSITYQSARKDALSIVDMALAHD